MSEVGTNLQLETLGRGQTDLASQVQDKKWALEMSARDVTETQKQTEEYRNEANGRKEEYAKAQKALPKRSWIEFGTRGTRKDSKRELNTAKVQLSGLFNVDMGFARRVLKQETADKDESDENDDAGYQLVNRLSYHVHRLHGLLIHGPENLNGVNWDQLTGRGDGSNSIRNISQLIHKELEMGYEKQTSVTQEALAAIKPVQDVCCFFLHSCHILCFLCALLRPSCGPLCFRCFSDK